MRGVFVAEEDNYKSYYIDSIFNAIWQDGLNMNDENVIEKILSIYVENRKGDELFIDTYRRIGIDPFKEKVYPENLARKKRGK